MASDIHQRDKEPPSPRNPSVQSGPDVGLPWIEHYPGVTEDSEGTKKVLLSGLLTVSDIPVLLSCLLQLRVPRQVYSSQETRQMPAPFSSVSIPHQTDRQTACPLTITAIPQNA